MYRRLVVAAFSFTGCLLVLPSCSSGSSWTAWRASPTRLIMKQRIIATANSVVTRFEAPPVKRRPELVVGKYYRKGKPLSASINSTLRKLDPEGKHFAFYVFTGTKRVADAPTTQQIQRALTLKGEVGPRMTLSPHYNKLRSPTALTR
eukprot:COSAG05_NODE_6120_length_1018_cov_13.522307_2_plen_148_part_00